MSERSPAPVTSNELTARIRRYLPYLGLYTRDIQDLIEETDRQRAEIERLTRERDEWAQKWHRIRAELAELKYPGMKGVIKPKGSADETTARRMTRAEADAMNRAFWRSVEIIDDIDDREEVAPGDARYYRPSEKASARPSEGPGSILGCTCIMCEYHRSAEDIERKRRAEPGESPCGG